MTDLFFEQQGAPGTDGTTPREGCSNGHPSHPDYSFCPYCGEPVAAGARRATPPEPRDSPELTLERIAGSPSPRRVVPPLHLDQEDGTEPIHSPPAPRPGSPRRARRAGRRLTTIAVLVALVGATAYGGYRIVQYRLLGNQWIAVGDVSLTATPISVGTSTGGVVSAIDVNPEQRVAKGQPLANVVTSVLDPKGVPVSASSTIVAPEGGIVTSVDRSAGSVVTFGQPILTMYDPGKLDLVGAVAPQELASIRLGMTAQISGPGLNVPLAARVTRVEPVVGNAPPATSSQQPASSNLSLVLTPVNESAVADLLPGLVFSARIDARSGGDHAPTGAQVG